MPTLPIIAVFVLQTSRILNDNRHGYYVMFEYADKSRSNPEELTTLKVIQLAKTLQANEIEALESAVLVPNNWVYVS